MITNVINTQNSLLSNYLLHFTIIHALEVIYICCIHVMESLYAGVLCSSLLNSLFSDVTSVAWNWLCLEYLHHRHWQMLQIQTFTKIIQHYQLVVKLLPTHHWLGVTDLGWVELGLDPTGQSVSTGLLQVSLILFSWWWQRSKRACFYSLAWNWPTLTSTNIPLANATHMAKPSIHGMGQHTPSLVGGTAKSHEAGCGWGTDEAVETRMLPGKVASRDREPGPSLLKGKAVL